MKEDDLIDLGLKSEWVSAEESGDQAFYYYFKEFGENKGIILISPANDEVKDGEWYVGVLEDYSIRIDKKKDLEDFIEVVTRITNK